MTPKDRLFSQLLDMFIVHCQRPENQLDSFGWPSPGQT
jgi:hypothetical protein